MLHGASGSSATGVRNVYLMPIPVSISMFRKIHTCTWLCMHIYMRIGTCIHICIHVCILIILIFAFMVFILLFAFVCICL